MSETEYRPMTPEQLAVMYEISPYDEATEAVVEGYNKGHYIKWSLDKDNFNITVWTNTILNAVDHAEVNLINRQAGTDGHISKDSKTFFNNPKVFTEDEKEAVDIALRKYLSK